METEVREACIALSMGGYALIAVMMADSAEMSSAAHGFFVVLFLLLYLTSLHLITKRNGIEI